MDDKESNAARAVAKELEIADVRLEVSVRRA
jgi:hypothetical protein